MSYDQLVDRVHFMVYGDDAWRASIVKGADGTPEICYDVHGMTAKKAVQSLEDLVKVCRSPMVLEVIHGFNHGTAIKDSLNSVSFDDRIVNKYSPENNPGVTFFTLQSA